MWGRIASFLQVRSGEGKKAAFVALLFALIQAGQGIGGNAADSLFFIRFGVDFLPYLFMALGALTFGVTLVYSAGLIRVPQRPYFALVLGGFASLLIIERLAVVSDAAPLYPVVWLSVNLINSILGAFIWYIAGEVCDTRQAKRLFSIFASAGILGGVVGNLLTGLLARSLGTENLLLLYALFLFAALGVTLQILRQFFHEPVKRDLGETFWSDIRSGYDYVRGSRFLQLTAYSSVLFSILYFSISFPFSQAASRSFQDEAALAGFLGLFSSAATGLTFLVSLFLANRLYTRIGIVNSVFLLPLVYIGGFVLWAGNFVLATAILARLAQLVVLGGIASSAWSALFNIVPPERRGQVLGFDAGVPSQIGVVLSGVLLILGSRVLDRTQILYMGMAVGLVCAFIVWHMRHAYGDALVHALRAGRFEVFSISPRAFVGYAGNASALDVVFRALREDKPSTRRIAAEVLGRMGDPAALPLLVRATEDADPQVRLAALRSIDELDGSSSGAAILRRLRDADPDVRATAAELSSRLQSSEHPELVGDLKSLLEDETPAVATKAAVALARMGDDQAALARLCALAGSDDVETRVRAVQALGQIAADREGQRAHVEQAAGRLYDAIRDQSPAVRRAACLALAADTSPMSMQALLECLADPETSVRQAASASLRSIGSRTVPALLERLRSSSEIVQGAVLDALPPNDPALVAPLAEYLRREAERIRRLQGLRAAVPGAGRVTRLIRESLNARVVVSETRLIQATGLLGHPDVMQLVAKSINSRTGEHRAEAIEALETLGDKHLARGIVPLLEEVPLGHSPMSASAALTELLDDPDIWTRSFAARAAGELKLREPVDKLKAVAQSDPEGLARQAASRALEELGEERPMETLQTISSLERILLLREVPLFAELSPDDLKQISEVTREELYPDDAVLSCEGDEGNEMYVVVSGQVAVIRRVNGEDKILARRGAGEVVGEMAIIDAAPRSATLRAEGEVRVLVLEDDAFRAIIRDRPEVSLAVMRVMSRRLRESR